MDRLTEPLARPSIPDEIAERITGLIANGTLRPGDRLPSEPELARQVQVGRTSLREALRKLATLGVIEIVRGKGTFIREAPADNPMTQLVRWSATEGFATTEVLEARISLEATAVGLACARATAEDLEELDQFCAAHDEAEEGGDRDTLVKTDEKVHDALVGAGHNPVLLRMHRSLVPELAEFRRHTVALRYSPERTGHGHATIVDAIRRHDPAAARRAVVNHLWTYYQNVCAAAETASNSDERHVEDPNTFA
jgi:GntR family transcriptional repressor for pyruvate dehydrogenase complex